MSAKVYQLFPNKPKPGKELVVQSPDLIDQAAEDIFLHSSQRAFHLLQARGEAPYGSSGNMSYQQAAAVVDEAMKILEAAMKKAQAMLKKLKAESEKNKPSENFL
ncbi:MAG TPA: hypothetical protein VHD31_01445 [Candidatus Paceibacterota bacterium]|nr:hypothetical protein [Candidatus Paceibacterota bacterium]